MTLEVAIILICKHAALLSLLGISTKLALTQAESDYQNANIASTIEDHLVASTQDYSIENSVDFLIKTHIGLSSLASTKIQTVADTTFTRANRMIGVEYRGYVMLFEIRSYLKLFKKNLRI